MRKFLSLLLAAPLFMYGQDKTVVNVERVWPKADKVQQFEKALATHVQKFHKGDYSWRVYTIETGPDVGAYHIVEGPSSWDFVDKRGEISKEHQNDWNTNIQPLVDKSTNSYFTYRADLSSTPVDSYTDKISINHIFLKPGFYPEMVDIMKSNKKAWDESGQSVAVYEASASGEPQIAVVTRYKFGLKEREVGFHPAMAITFAKANGGESAYTKAMEVYKQATDHSWSEMLFYKPELSTK